MYTYGHSRFVFHQCAQRLASLLDDDHSGPELEEEELDDAIDKDHTASI